jgi:ppGpp synthetase/RelA/SpoT-type nucleotidyltranferase
VVEARSKTVTSFAEKLQREGKSYKDPFNEITDFAGLRIILYYVDDVQRTCEVIDREFKIDEPRSVDKRSVLAADQFGYLSVHKIVTLSEARANLPEWAGLSDLVAEIQIRPVLQHSWAAISHALQYKREADVPYEFRRKLMMLSGLLELADEEFASLRKQQVWLRKDIAEKVAVGNLNIAINFLSLQEFIRKSNLTKEYEQIATELGFLVEDDDMRGVSQVIQLCQLLGWILSSD